MRDNNVSSKNQRLNIPLFNMQEVKHLLNNSKAYMSSLILLITLAGNSSFCLSDINATFTSNYDLSGENAYRSYTSINSLTGIETETILASADELLNPANYGPRRLNDQWLRLYSSDNQKSLKMGRRAGAKILKMGLKAYWQKVRNKKLKDVRFIPDAEGRGTFYAVNYRVNLSGKKLRFKVKYDF